MKEKMERMEEINWSAVARKAFEEKIEQVEFMHSIGNKSKLSKRYGAVSVTDYKEQGYLLEAIVNFVAFIGWNPGDNREIMSLNELVESFSLEKVQKGGAIFNAERLDWYNKEYIRKKATAELGEMLIKYLPEKWAEVAEQKKDYWHKIVELERYNTLTTGRELKMLELKKRIRELEAMPASQ